MIKNNSILRKVLFNNLLIMLIPLIIIMCVICYMLCASYKKEEQRKAQDYISEYATQINAEIETALQRSEYILNNREITKGLKENFKTAYKSYMFASVISNYIDNITNNNGLTYMTIYTGNPTLFESKYVSRLEELDGYESYVSRFRDENTSIIWDTDLKKDEDGQEYFVFYRNFSLNSGSILVGKVYLPSRPVYSQNAFVVKYDPDYNNNKFVTAHIKKLFTAVMALDFESIYRYYFNYIAIFSAFGLFFIISIIFLTYMVNSNTLLEVNNFIKKITENDIYNDESALSSNSHELNELIVIKRTINSLIERVKDITNLFYKTEEQKRRVELSLLQSKLGPHILYNSLSVIKLNIFENKNENSIALIDDLVKYYRSILNFGQEMIPISKELEMTRQYVRIYSIAHEKTYELIINVDDKIAELPVLHLILQPFIENAIIHGLSGTRTNCKITISADIYDGFLIFKIADNGYGMPDDIIQKLNDMERYADSYGIKNTFQRIQLIYGADSEIKFESILGLGTTVIIKFRL